MGQGAQDRRREEPLTTWKEIAAYLGVTVRTAQKWERKRALPVHRVPGGRGRVWAKPAELDAWQSSAPAAEARKPAGPSSRRLGPAVISLLAAGAVGAALVASGVIRSGGGQPAWFHIEDHAFVVCDAGGRELWRKPLPKGWRDEAHRGQRRAWIGDLSGDSGKEVLLVATGSTAEAPTRLYCFDSSGEELWRFEVRGEVRTGDEIFRPPYMVEAFAVSPGEPHRIVVVSCHHAYFPAQVAILDGKGRLLSEYWHSGFFWAVTFADLDGDGRSELYLGGTSNGRGMATLVAFDPDNVSGASAEPEPYQLLGFGPGTEMARIFFPSTCINRAVDERNLVKEFRLNPPTLIVLVREGAVSGPDVFYHFTGRLQLEEVVPSDGFLTLHRQLRESGRLDHAWSREEEESLRNIIRLPSPDS